jgi:hypothetical protein
MCISVYIYYIYIIYYIYLYVYTSMFHDIHDILTKASYSLVIFPGPAIPRVLVSTTSQAGG